MGREIKRVPKFFDWPLGWVWKGYINPYSGTKCKFCDGRGLNEKTKLLSDQWYAHSKVDINMGWCCYNIEQEDVQALIDVGRLWDFTRVPLTEEHKRIVKEKIENGGNSWLPFDNGNIPTAQEVNEWSKKGFGHDSMNQWVCVKAKAKRLGFYGFCELCNGEGEYWCEDKYKKLCEEWKCIEPPEGSAYQLWETTSEGSPLSPPLESPENLAKWLFENKVSSFGSSICTYEQWLSFIVGCGVVPSAISINGKLMSGVEAIEKK